LNWDEESRLYAYIYKEFVTSCASPATSTTINAVLSLSLSSHTSELTPLTLFQKPNWKPHVHLTYELSSLSSSPTPMLLFNSSLAYKTPSQPPPPSLPTNNLVSPLNYIFFNLPLLLLPRNLFQYSFG
jgi:hypothetical protein